MADGGSWPRFVLDGELVEANDITATTTLLNFLRERRELTGTKEGCAEGDCGACTVAVGELEGERLRWSAVNSCIRFVPTLDGKEVVTVQGLAGHDGRLHPVQQALVDHHGSQCGFCTPGFVMSLFTHYLELGDETPTRDGLLAALSGNLCRCTGYRPIMDAGLAMMNYPAPSRWNVEDAHAPERVARLRALQRSDNLTVPDYTAPRSLAEFASAYAAHPESLILAGGTDIGLWATKQLRTLPPLLYIGDVVELNTVMHMQDEMLIGAAVRLEDAFEQLVTAYPQLQELAVRFGSRPIRNSGTLCGNIANGSPIGDAIPALIAIGTTVRLRRDTATREIPLEDLYQGYQKKNLLPGEFVEALSVPMPKPDTRFAFYKIAKRIDQDISAVCAGIAVTVNAGLVEQARIAYGGMAATPRRALKTEQALTGQRWSEEALEAAARRLPEDYTPLSDMRASAAYRSTVAANLLRRFWYESQGDCVTRIDTARPVQVNGPILR